MNLAAKLCIATKVEQSKLLCQYILNLAKYDMNYDIRDRARFLRQLVLPNQVGNITLTYVSSIMVTLFLKETALSKYTKKILLSTKPAPVLESSYKGRGQWQLGSLTHAINGEALGYVPLPDFPKEAPDPSVREVQDDSWGRPRSGSTKKKNKGFYDDDDDDDDDKDSSDDSSFYSSISGSDGSGTEDSESDSEGMVTRSSF